MLLLRHFSFWKKKLSFEVYFEGVLLGLHRFRFKIIHKEETSENVLVGFQVNATLFLRFTLNRFGVISS